MNTIRLLSVGVLAAVLVACNTTPSRNSILEHARNHLETAQRDPQVASLAAQELGQASDSIRRAEKAKSDGASEDEVDHLSYIGDQRVTIAQEAAASRAAQAKTSSASAARVEMRLAARTQEAESAQSQLATSEQTNAMQSGQLAEAQSSVQRGNVRIGDLEQQLVDLGAKKTDRGMVVTLGGVLFYTGQARLLPSARHDMIQLANILRSHPERQAMIEGNTDNVGLANDNLSLSQRRADAVSHALVKLGVDAGQLQTSANGSDKPVAGNETAAGRQMNRRVEVIFLAQHEQTSDSK